MNRDKKKSNNATLFVIKSCTKGLTNISNISCKFMEVFLFFFFLLANPNIAHTHTHGLQHTLNSSDVLVYSAALRAERTAQNKHV